MDEKLTFQELMMQTANQNASEVNDTNITGNKQLSLIQDILGSNWNDKNGESTLLNLNIIQQNKKSTDNQYLFLTKAMQKATLGASEIGSSIDINATNVENQIEKAKTSVSAPIQSAINLLNQAAGLAPKFAGDINGAISQLQTATTSIGQLGKDVTIKFAKIRKVEQDLKTDLDNIKTDKIVESIINAPKEVILPSSAQIEIEKYERTKIKKDEKSKAYIPSSAQIEIDKYERVKAKKEQEEKMKNYVPSSAQVEMDKARKAGIKVPIAGAINTLGSSYGMPQFGPDGLLIKQKSDAGQKVINKLFAEIPSHANGKHSAKLDAMIDALSTEECVWVLSRIENEAFGQKSAGYSKATPESHRAFVEQQVIERFDGDIHKLLKKWGTFKYTGY